jgi:hypothetical protein
MGTEPPTETMQCGDLSFTSMWAEASSPPPVWLSVAFTWAGAPSPAGANEARSSKQYTGLPGTRLRQCFDPNGLALL